MIVVKKWDFEKENGEEIKEIIDDNFDNLNMGKQEKLVDGVNIKTINKQSILGEGDLEVGGGTAFYLKNFITEDF